MSPERRLAAIILACGWTIEESNLTDGRCWHLDGIQSEEAPPDYLNDLNAMHKAEKMVDSHAYWNNLRIVVIRDMDREIPIRRNFCPSEIDICIACATANIDQRVEAFLRTINKWEE